LPQPQIKSDFLKINQIVTDPTKIPGKIAEYKIRVNAPAKLQAKKSHPFVSKKKSVKKEKKQEQNYLMIVIMKIHQVLEQY